MLLLLIALLLVGGGARTLRSRSRSRARSRSWSRARSPSTTRAGSPSPTGSSTGSSGSTCEPERAASSSPACARSTRSPTTTSSGCTSVRPTGSTASTAVARFCSQAPQLARTRATAARRRPPRSTASAGSTSTTTRRSSSPSTTTESAFIGPDGKISTIAGTGEEGYAGDGGPATTALLKHPHDIATRVDREVVIADSQNGVLRRVDPAGVITTLAKGFRAPVAVQGGAGNSLFVADAGANAIYKLTPDGSSRRVVGRATAPAYLAVDENDTLYVSELGRSAPRAADPARRPHARPRPLAARRGAS